MKDNNDIPNRSALYTRLSIYGVTIILLSIAAGVFIAAQLGKLVPVIAEHEVIQTIIVFLIVLPVFGLYIRYLAKVFRKSTKSTTPAEHPQPPSPQPLTSPPPKPAPSTLLPARLATPKAMAIWSKAQQTGFVSDDYQFIGSRSELSIFAGNFSIYLFGKCDWVLFKQWTDYHNYAKTYSDYSKKPKDKLPERMREIQALFE